MRKAILTLLIITFTFTGGYGREAHAAAAELYSTDLFNDANLKAYYRLENTLDSKGSFHLTNFNSVATTSAKFGYGESSGTSNANKRLSTTTALSVTGSYFSWSGWVKLLTEPGVGAYESIFYYSRSSDKTQFWLNYFNESSIKKLRFSRTTSGVAQKNADYTVALGTSNFYHIAGTYDGSYIRNYINGVEVASTTSSGSGSSATVDCLELFAGSQCSTPSYYGSFVLDDAAFFDRVLSASEISDIYNGASGGGSVSSPKLNDIIIFE